MHRRQRSPVNSGDDDDETYKGGYEPRRSSTTTILRQGVRSLAAATALVVTSPLSKLSRTKKEEQSSSENEFSFADDASSDDSYIFDDDDEQQNEEEVFVEDDTEEEEEEPIAVVATSRRGPRLSNLGRRSAASTTKTPARQQQQSNTVDEGTTVAFIDPWEVRPAEGTNTEDDANKQSTFLGPQDIHSNMVNREEDIARLRLLAGQLSADWRGQDFMAPALARRIRDFQFAQEKRRKKYGDERPWGILGLYDHLSGIRIDVEWAEDAAWRRANGEPYLSWADFDASKKKGINRPWFTYIILFVCTVSLVASFALNGWKIEALDVNPMIGPSAQTLVRMGAKVSDLIVNHSEAWRLVSPIILHAGLVHYVVNMAALWFVGSAIEKNHGFIAATILFIVPAIGGTILSALFLPEYITVGASGGIFGLIGACLADIVMNWKLLFSDFVTENGRKHRHALVIVFIVVDILLNCVIGLTPFVDNFTHLGGMVIGFLSGLSTMERLSADFFGMKEGCWIQAKQIVVRFFGLIISIIGIAIATIVLFEGDGETTPCPNCKWLSCVPFPTWAGADNKWWYCDDCDRVTADIVYNPSLHLQLACPDGTSVSVALDDKNKDDIDRDQLISNLPSYCREYCPEIN